LVFPGVDGGAPGAVPRLGWPVPGRVTSLYGPRYLPGLGSDFHAGTDFSAPMGTPVRAVGAGRVALVGSSRGGGLHVGIAHPGGLHSGYLHLSRQLVSLGQPVAQGQVIASSGNTGAYTTGPHLHLQLGRGASFWTNHFNPLPFLQAGGFADGGLVGKVAGAGFADGGLVDRVPVFDRGGWAEPGLNLINNATGRPEPFRNAELPVRLDEYTIDALVQGFLAGSDRAQGRAVRDRVLAMTGGLTS